MKAGLCCEATDMQKYKENLIELFNNKELYNQLSFNARKYYEKSFNVENNYICIKNIMDNKNA